jgi:phosphatidylglycerophosphate synthase
LRVPPFSHAIGRGLGGWTLTVVMLDWHLGMVETEDGRPRPLGPADALTLARAWLIPAVADRPRPLLCAAGLATDALDGRVARATEPTRLGRDLEGLVDACFEVAVLRGMSRRGTLGRPAAAIEIIRVALGCAYGAASYFGRAEPPSRSVLGAARVLTPVRAATLLGAAQGRRGSDRLVIAGSLLSTAALGAGLARRRRTSDGGSRQQRTSSACPPPIGTAS